MARLRASTVFTTHTPVPAGNEIFDPSLVEQNVAPLVARCGFSWDEFVALGRVDDGDGWFGLTPFALRTSSYANGVSALHGEVSRSMWQGLWPDRAGRRACRSARSRTASTRARGSREELDALLGTEEDMGTPDFARAYDLDDEALWHVQRHARAALLDFMRSRGLPGSFDPDALTIGFARRFATYKRADLIFSDPDRLARAARRRRAPAADRPRRQGAPGRRGREGADPEGRRVRAQPARRTAASSSCPTTR